MYFLSKQTALLQSMRLNDYGNSPTGVARGIQDYAEYQKVGVVSKNADNNVSACDILTIQQEYSSVNFYETSARLDPMDIINMNLPLIWFS